MTTATLITDLMRDEGFRREAYPDPKSGGAPWTIGYGHTGREVHPGLAWTLGQAAAALSADITAACGGLTTALPWWTELSPVRQDVLANMAFNLGVHGLLEFRNMLSDVRARTYALASAEMLLSDWARDPPEGVGERATRLAAMMKTGSRPLESA